MTTARERAQRAATKAVLDKPYEQGNHDLIAADAASDVWEPIVRDLLEGIEPYGLDEDRVLAAAKRVRKALGDDT